MNLNGIEYAVGDPSEPLRVDMATSDSKRMENGTRGGSVTSNSIHNGMTCHTASVKQKRMGIKQSGTKRSTETKANVRKPSKTQERKTKMRSQRERDNVPLSKPFYNESCQGENGDDSRK